MAKKMSDSHDELCLSVVLPGYAEEDNILTAVTACQTALNSLGVSYEIIIIDDASPDRTGEIADELAAAHAEIRVIHNPINLNVGASILIGYRAARGKLVTHNAMDLPFDLMDLGLIIPLFDDPALGLVVVSRTDRTAHSVWRKITSLVHYWMVRTLFWVALPDMNFVQVCRRSVVNALPVRARSPAFVTPEMIMRVRDSGYRIAEVSAVFHSRKQGEAKFGRPRDILWTFADLISYWLERFTHVRGPRQ